MSTLDLDPIAAGSYKILLCFYIIKNGSVVHPRPLWSIHVYHVDRNFSPQNNRVRPILIQYILSLDLHYPIWHALREALLLCDLSW